MSDPRKRLVKAGYDELGERYVEWSDRIEGDPRAQLLGDLAMRLRQGTRVLDLGCGTGVPWTRWLADRFEVVGVDISGDQLRLARRNVPGATFVRSDLAELDAPSETVHAVVALYSISHIPREEHARLFTRVASWLEPGGFFVATLGAEGTPDWTDQWLGVPMFFSSYVADANRALLRDAGFELLRDEVVETREPDGRAAVLCVLARRS
ncbi:MAG: class I SAM-dependent methyltransferase [Gaiellaceae bacterium]